MSKKINIKVLSIIFLVLLTIVVAVVLFEPNKNERTFRKEIVNIDTTTVNSITIFPKSKDIEQIKLVKTNNQWKLELDGKTLNADQPMIENMLTELTKLKPERVAATTKEKWATYQVNDTSATRVQINVDDDIVADIMIGKFSYQQAKQNPNMQQNPYNRQPQYKITSFVRVVDEDEVYAVDGMLSMTFNRDVNTYRNKDVTGSDIENWTKLTYTYPADSSYTLIKESDKWMINGIMADSTKTANFLNTLSYTTCSDFVDNSETNLNNELFKLTIEGNNISPIEIKAFAADTINKHFITSNLNDGATYSSANSGLAEKIFVAQSNFSISNNESAENLTE